MKNFIIIIVIIVIFVAVYTIFSKKGSNTVEQARVETIEKQQENQPSKVLRKTQAQQTAKYTENGFEPNILIVPTGTTIIFINNSRKSMWVASNPHPAHTDLSTFDQKEGVGEEKSYSFTFTQEGSWEYHNHLIPKDTGTIIVE